MDLLESKLNFSSRHPWEISRKQCLVNLVAQSPSGNILDVGAGDLYLAESLAVLSPQYKTWALDSSFEKSKSEENGVICVRNLNQLPNKFFKTVTFFDVLEHIEDASGFISQLFSQIEPPEQIFVSVPAFQFLYGEHDRFLQHKRRYNLQQIKNEFDLSQYEVKEQFYFYFSLYLVRTLQKFFKIEESKQIVNWKFSNNNIITRFFVVALNVDFFLCKLLSMLNIYPPGLSVCLTLRKKTSNK